HAVVGALSSAVQLAVNEVTRARGVIYVSISQSDTRALLEAAPGRGWDFANFRPVSEGLAATA
ncbi:MAG: hypothetical protein JSV48_10830, partial [Bradyrhizobium sp.]